MSDYTKYTKQEMQAYAIAKNIKENQIVIVGTGLPLIGASLAKRAVCPSCHPIVESGLMDCDPVEVPRSVGDNRFMDHVDYITSCGWMDGPGGRERAGLPGNRGPQMVVTDLGIMKFDEETKRMYLAYYYPFSSPEMVQENTGFEIDVSRAELMEGPSPEIIRLIREEIDPGQAFIKVPKDK